MKRSRHIALVLSFLLFFNLGFSTTKGNIVRAVLFFSPTCPHCHKVMEEDLPPLVEKYQDRLAILQVDVSNPQGQKLYIAMVEKFQLPQERLGVPALVIGDRVLVGSREIPDLFPGIIESGLASGGIPWPDVPGIEELTPEEVDLLAGQSENTSAISGKFWKDPLGSSTAVIILIAMIVSVIIIGYQAIKGSPPIWQNPPMWLIPGLCVVGLAIASYLSYVELSHSVAICGPVGDCNAVQQSSYAKLFGVLSIGVFGIAGYFAILIGWIMSNYGPIKYRNISTKITWGFALFGVFFMIYLTFLEPFVIGAVCAWCLTTAIIMTLIFWSSSIPVLKELSSEEIFPE